MAGDCETIRSEKTFCSVKMCRMDKGAKMLQSGEVQRNWTLNVGLHSGVHKGLESRVFRKRRKGCCSERWRCLPEYSLLMLGRLAGQELLMGRPCWGIPWFPYMSRRLAGTGIWRHRDIRSRFVKTGQTLVH